MAAKSFSGGKCFPPRNLPIFGLSTTRILLDHVTVATETTHNRQGATSIATGRHSFKRDVKSVVGFSKSNGEYHYPSKRFTTLDIECGKLEFVAKNTFSSLILGTSLMATDRRRRRISTTPLPFPTVTKPIIEITSRCR